MKGFRQKVNLKKPPALQTQMILQRKHFLFVGSSIGHNLNFPLLEHHTGAKISKAKAYTAVKNDMPNSFKAPFPGKNFSTVVPAELSKKQYKVLFLQGGSTEVSNLKTNSILLVDEYKETIKQASENIFKVAEDAIKKSPGLEKVIIFERIPRHDADQHGLKSELSKYGNQSYINSGARVTSKIRLSLVNTI